MQHAKSEAAFEEAKQYIPGGVNSPVRSFRSVGGVPPIIAGGAGSKLTDIDGNEYIDYVLSYGPLLLGHAHPVVTEAIKKAAEKGSCQTRMPPCSFHGHGTHGKQRHRSHHERTAPGTRLYRTRQHC